MTVPSSHRPLPLFGRTDLQTQQVSFGGQECVVVKEPLGLQYYRLSLQQYHLLQLLNGRRSLKDLVDELRAVELGVDIDLDTIQKLILDLGQKNLIWNRRQQADAAEKDQNKKTPLQWVQTLIGQIFFIRLPAWNSEPLLRFLYPVGQFLFSPLFVVTMSMAILMSWGMLLSHFDEFQRRMPTLSSLFNYRDVLLLWVAIGGAKLIHELGHGLACMRFGGRCHGIGVAFLMFSPCLYCDVSDAWMLPSKRSRILIATAGIWIELMMSAGCLVLWWNSAPGLFHDLCLQMFLVTSVSTVLFNTNPFLKYDGYYILSDLVEVPNLQQYSQRVIQESLRSLFFGVPWQEEPTTAHIPRFWFFLYGICSTIYKWSIVIGIGFFLNQFFEQSGLQALSWCYVGVSVVAALNSFTTMAWNVVASGGWSSSMLLRSCVNWSLLISGLIGLWNVPLPNRFSAPLMIEPFAVQHVYVDSPGLLESLNVNVGDVVQAGTPLALLANPDLKTKWIETVQRSRLSEVDLQFAQATSNPDVATLARQSIRSARIQQQDAERQLDRLVLKAPCAGRIISAPEVQMGVKTDKEERFAGETAIPLDVRNLGAPLTRRFQVCSIAPLDAWQAVAWVNQNDCQFLDTERPVNVMLDAYPGKRIAGKIERIAAAGDREIPEQLSAQFGGSLSTQTPNELKTAAETLYQVTVTLNAEDLPLSTGLRGSGRFERPRETAGDWLIRSYYQIFQLN